MPNKPSAINRATPVPRVRDVRAECLELLVKLATALGKRTFAIPRSGELRPGRSGTRRYARSEYSKTKRSRSGQSRRTQRSIIRCFVGRKKSAAPDESAINGEPCTRAARARPRTCAHATHVHTHVCAGPRRGCGIDPPLPERAASSSPAPSARLPCSSVRFVPGCRDQDPLADCLLLLRALPRRNPFRLANPFDAPLNFINVLFPRREHRENARSPPPPLASAWLRPTPRRLVSFSVRPHPNPRRHSSAPFFIR